MKFECHFKGLDHSASLVEYVESKFSHKLQKFEIKPAIVTVTFSAVKHEKHVEVFFTDMGKRVRASSTGQSFTEIVDLVVGKIARQMARVKSRVKRHRALGAANFERVKEGHLTDYELTLKRKSG